MKVKLVTFLITLLAANASSAQSATYCNASLSLDGSDDFGSIPNVFFQNVNQRDFTIEFYLKADASQTQYPGIWGKSGYWSEINVEMYTSGKVRYAYCTSFSGYQCFSSDTVSWTANVWDHYAIVGDGNNDQLRIYKNGILDATSPHGIPDWSLPNNDSKLGAVYQGWTGPNTQYLKGKLDDFRVSNVARYTSNFTPPQNLTNDNNTRVLYNFNNVLAGVVPDLSGNNINLTLQNGAILDANDVPYVGSNLSITSQPTNTTANPNATAQFSVVTSNASSYQWQSDLGLGFQNVSNAGQYSGATNDTLTVSNITNSNNNQQFRCIINSNGCADTTTVAILSVSTNGLNEFASQNGFTISPNPTKENFTISGLEKLGSISSIELKEANGKVVKVLDPKATEFKISELKAGVYFLNISTGSIQEVIKIFKE